MKKSLLLLVFLIASTTALADRGRPVISGGTFVTDAGQLMRGLQYSLDYNGGLPPGCVLNAPSCSLIDNMKNFGMNSLHIYAEKQGTPVGTNATNIDQMVNWAGNAGLYAVIVIGGPGCDITYTTSFWQFYAPRYANRTHVMYEIKNEPEGSWYPPSAACVTDMNKQVYTTIRGLAPASPVLLFSYAFFEDGTGLVTDIDTVSTVVNWSNAGVAFHGYQKACTFSGQLGCDDPSTTEAAINYVRSQRPAVALVNTEFYVVWDTSVNPNIVKQGKTQMYEDRHVSWLSFIPIDYVQDWNVKDPIDAEEVVWSNEWGLPWPAVNAPPASNSVVSLRASNGKYASVNTTTTKVYANGTSVAGPQKFIVKPGGGGYVCLQSWFNNKYAGANLNNLYKFEASILNCSNARLEWMKRPNGAVVLRSQNNGQTVDANTTGDSQLIAKRIDTSSGEHTNFTVAIIP